ncbi:pantoate--beta-alanine ligase [Humidesulfovibrio idahonensis]
MDLITTPTGLRQQCREWRKQGLTIALVPTMGFLHAGHMSLMDHARLRADRLVVSVFVNPTQFGPNEDLDSYPRDLPHDLAIAEEHGAAAVFAPEPGAMYHPDHATWVEVPEMGKLLCGASRPIHFRGVCTVVLKLLNLVRPDVAVFGEKDWQQLAILRRMARDLDLDVELVGRPIFRESDGLALSSRNVYLTPEERRKAPAIHEGILLVEERMRAGERDPEALGLIFREHLADKLPGARIDYASFVHPQSLAPAASVTAGTLLAVAVFVGKVRLIDNKLLEV